MGCGVTMGACGVTMSSLLLGVAERSFAAATPTGMHFSRQLVSEAELVSELVSEAAASGTAVSEETVSLR